MMNRLLGTILCLSGLTLNAASIDADPDFTVTTADDVVNAADGKLSFREVLQKFVEGQTDRDGGYVVTFAIPGERNPVIRLNRALPSLDGEKFTAENPLVIIGDNGRDRVTFDSNGERGIFQFEHGGGLVLEHCTLTGGNATYGGGVNIAGGEVELNGVTISNSCAVALGGAVYADRVFAENCMFIDCRAESGGGAIALADGGFLSAENCAFYGNDACVGGAVYGKSGADIALARVTLGENSADDGAAVCVGVGSVLSLENCVLCENVLGYDDSGIVYGEYSETMLHGLTTWGNVLAKTSAPAPVFTKWEGEISLYTSLIGEAETNAINQTDRHTFYGLDRNNGGGYFVLSNGVPCTAEAVVDGVRHLYRIPTQNATRSGSSDFTEMDVDLFGNERVNRTCGAVDFGSVPPAPTAEITHPDLQEDVDLDDVQSWVEAQDIDIDELNESPYALASYLLGTPLQTAAPELTITAFARGPTAGIWLVTVHAVATYEDAVHEVVLGEQNVDEALAFFNGRLTVAAADTPAGPWTPSPYNLSNITFTVAGDAVVAIDAGTASAKYIKVILTK